MAVQGILGSFTPFLKNLPKIVTRRIKRVLPTHAALINETSVNDDTAGAGLTPQCVWAGQADNGDPFSLWVWMRNGDIDAVCVIANWERDGKKKLGMEFTRMAYNQITVTAREQSGTFPFVVQKPAPGYIDFSWDA